MLNLWLINDMKIYCFKTIEKSIQRVNIYRAEFYYNARVFK